MRKAYNASNRVVRKKRKKIRLFNVVVFAFIVYFVYTICEQQIKINSYNSKIETYKADIDSKTKLASYYDNQKTNIESDEYIEDVARDTLGYVKPYEKIFIDANK